MEKPFCFSNVLYTSCFASHSGGVNQLWIDKWVFPLSWSPLILHSARSGRRHNLKVSKWSWEVGPVQGFRQYQDRHGRKGLYSGFVQRQHLVQGRMLWFQFLLERPWPSWHLSANLEWETKEQTVDKVWVTACVQQISQLRCVLTLTSMRMEPKKLIFEKILECWSVIEIVRACFIEHLVLQGGLIYGRFFLAEGYTNDDSSYVFESWLTVATIGLTVIFGFSRKLKKFWRRTKIRFLHYMNVRMVQGYRLYVLHTLFFGWIHGILRAGLPATYATLTDAFVNGIALRLPQWL